MEIWESGFAIHLQVSLSNAEGEMLLGNLGVDGVEEEPLVNVVDGMEVVYQRYKA